MYSTTFFFGDGILLVIKQWTKNRQSKQLKGICENHYFMVHFQYINVMSHVTDVDASNMTEGCIECKVKWCSKHYQVSQVL